MGHIHRKIEALEKAAAVRRKASEELASRTLWSLSYQERELLIRAFGVEQAGRELSACETAARRAYTQAWKQEVQARGGPAKKVEHRDSIYPAIMSLLGHRVTLERLELIRDAMDRGGELSAQESEAVGVYVRETERLWRLAGFRSAAEFELFSRRTAGGKR
jgi:hypothetical protein